MSRRCVSGERAQSAGTAWLVHNEVRREAREHLLAAAAFHGRESQAMGAAHGLVPWGNVRGSDLLKRVERSNREALADTIRECRAYFAQAMDEIRQALALEGIVVP